MAQSIDKDFELPLLKVETVKVLLIEDEPQDAAKIASMFAREDDSQFDLDCVADLNGGLERVVRGPVDAVLMDLSLPGVSGLDGVNKLHSHRPELPIVVLAQPDEEELALAAVQNGAQDYLLKGKLDATLLSRATRHAIQQKQTEEALRNAAQEWRTTFDAIGSSVCLLDIQSVVYRCNRATTELLDRPFDQILGRNLCELLHGTARRADGCPLSGMLSSHERETSTVQVGERWYGVAVDPLLDRDGNLVGVVHIMGDITARKRMEEELEETRREQLRTRDLFLSHISHELRSPLAVTHMFVSILLDGLSGTVSDEQREYLLIILRNVEQLKFMIQELLEVTRAQTGKLVIEPLRISLDGVIQDTCLALKEIALSQDVELRVEPGDDLPDAYADPDRVRQIVTNLVDNGIKYMGGEGIVTVRAGVFEEDPNLLVISVEDDGPGIEPEETERIFEQLYQTRESMDIGRKGLGLGLYICKELVSRQGGTIWVESKLGKGSTFYFTVPVFSLKDIVYPIVAVDDSLSDSVSLLSLSFLPPEKHELTNSDKTALQRVRASIKGTLNADSDMLLPKLSDESDFTRLMILSNADRDEVAGLARRVRLEVDASGDLKERGFEYELSISQMKTIASEDTRTVWEGVEEIADNIEQQLETPSSARRNQNGWKESSSD